MSNLRILSFTLSDTTGSSLTQHQRSSVCVVRLIHGCTTIHCFHRLLRFLSHLGCSSSQLSVPYSSSFICFISWPFTVYCLSTTQIWSVDQKLGCNRFNHSIDSSFSECHFLGKAPSTENMSTQVPTAPELDLP